MNIDHLKLFRGLPRYENFIEVRSNNDGRWLFATNGFRAIGLKTDLVPDNIATDKNAEKNSSSLKQYFDRKFQKLDSQGFMTWLFSTDECKVCNGTLKVSCDTCCGTGITECDDCDGTGTTQVECDTCEGSGTRRVKCENCDSNGKVKDDCGECDATGKVKCDCDVCDGAGTMDDGSDCSECTDGETEESCEYCDDGKVEDDCPDCDDGYQDECCDDCDDGHVEDDCGECDSGELECPECDGRLEHKCPECKDVGKITNEKQSAVIDLNFLKDLSRGFFEEISIADSGEEAIVFRGQNIMAIVMPKKVDEFRIYKM